MIASGKGFTVTVAVIGVPGQLFAVGVIVNVTVTGDPVLLTKLPLILPEPLAPMEPPIVPTLSLVQLNDVPLTAPLIMIGVIFWPEQRLCDDGVATASGVGLTTTVAVIGVPGQLFAVGVIVNVTVTGALVVLVNAPLISPLPLAAIPVASTVLSLV